MELQSSVSYRNGSAVTAVTDSAGALVSVRAMSSACPVGFYVELLHNLVGLTSIDLFRYRACMVF